jgi:hypothetical protein
MCVVSSPVFAVGEAVRQRDRAVGRHGQDQHQLLEIGAVVLGVSQRRGRSRLAAALAAVRSGVGAVQRDRRGVVVQLRAVHGELADHGERQLGQQRRAVGIEELIQRAADAVVVEQPGLPGREGHQAGLEASGPAGQAVERLALHAQVAHQHPDRRRRRQAHAPVASRQMAIQQSRDIHPLQEAVDDRQRAQPAGLQLERARRLVIHHLSEETCTFGQNETRPCLPAHPHPSAADAS